jgi:HPt (histidine-containing phosphotransfer) domain-containing protein
MSSYSDLERIRELQDLLGSEAPEIVASMLASMTTAIDQLEAAVAAGELDEATQAVHRCRNDALMLGARQLQEALTELEAATRDWHEARVRIALERVREVWPPTRVELANLASAADSR